MLTFLWKFQYIQVRSVNSEKISTRTQNNKKLPMNNKLGRLKL